MKLYYVPASPYARKVRIVTRELGCDGKVEEVEQPPRDNSTGFHQKHPLARIPYLETDSDGPLYDSPVICEYLDAQCSGGLFGDGSRRWDALCRQALGDGMLDVLLPLRGEQLRDKEMQVEAIMQRHESAVSRALDSIEEKVGDVPDNPDIGDIAIACACGYLDFRFPEWDWRASRPKLAAWYAGLSKRPTFQATQHA